MYRRRGFELLGGAAMIWILAIAVLLLAYSNGANDNFKGVATLYGSNVLSYRSALLLATVATSLGSLSALAFGSALLVLFASRLGLPVSTTHVSCGALFGIGLVTQQARWMTIGRILVAWVTTLPVAALLAGVFAVIP